MIRRYAFLILILFISICIGISVGNILSEVNLDMVQKVDTAHFKTALNSSFPIIDTVYNSGVISISFSSTMKAFLHDTFGFDLNHPITILNSQYSLFYSFYEKGYPKYLEDEISKRQNNELEPDKPKDTTSKDLLKNESSITYEGDQEKSKSPEGGVVSSGKIVVQNETKYKLDISEMLKGTLNLKLDKKGPKVLIFHTHTTESYIKSISDLNKKSVATRTSDPRYNVVRVGEELAQNLRKKYGIEVIHNGTVHDSPNYNYSYSNSLQTVNKILKSYPSIQIVLDIHRDAQGGDANKLRVVKNINGKNAAQVMFVIGTDQNGLYHPKWRENLKLAVKLQDSLNQQVPGLVRPIDLSGNRYNQHVTNGAIIIEIGADGNTLNECLESTKYIAKAIHDVVIK